MKKQIRLYNIIMPLWLLMAYPIMWLPTLAGNFIIDSAVLMLLLKIKKIDNKKQIWKSCIINVWAFGMFSDITGAGALFLLVMTLYTSGYHTASAAIVNDPWEEPAAAVSVILCMVLSSVLIYLFDSRIAFKKIFEDEKERKRFALYFAILTTPWLFASSIVVW